MQILIAVLTISIVIAVNIFLQGLTILMIILTILFTAVGFFLVSVHLPLYFNSLSYEKTDDAIIKYSGVYLKRKEIIRFYSIQRTTVINAPFSFNSVTFTAQGGEVTLPFLYSESVVELSLIVKECNG
jgi:hypothetical protein